MNRSAVAGSALLMGLVVASSAPLEGLTRATHGLIALPSLVQRSAPDFQWRGAVARDGAVEIKGVNGDVRAELSTGPEVEVTAERKGRRSNPEDVRIEVVPHAGGVTICAVYPSRDASQPNECRPGRDGRMNVQNNDTTVTFHVRVPAGVGFVGKTVNGDVDAQGLQGAIAITTVNGSPTFSTSSYGAASTVNGSIRGSLGASGWTDALEFHTVNGSITLDLPGDLSADVRARTVNGEISTDFPIAVTGRLSRRDLSGTIGAGGRALELETVNGSVRLQRR